MSERNVLFNFFGRIDKDPRVRTTHISIFMVLYQRWLRDPGPAPVLFTGRDIMMAAKISSSVTYHRAIRALHEYGYIRYEPSFNRLGRSRVYLPVTELNVKTEGDESRVSYERGSAGTSGGVAQ